MNYKNTKINLDTQNESKRQLGLAHQELQQNASQFKALNENLQREVYSKRELLKNVEEQQRFYVRQLKEDNAKLVEETQTNVHARIMEYEDLRSFNLLRYDFILKLQETIKDRDYEISNLKEEVETHKNTIAKRDEDIIKLKNDVLDVKKELSDEIIKHAITS